MFLAPYAAAFLRKPVLYALGAAVLAALAFGGYQGVMRLRAIATLEHERAETATAELARKTAELAANQRNAEISEQLVAEDILRVRNQKTQAERLMEKYRHAPKPVPVGCENVLDPIRDGLLVVHELRLGSDGSSPISNPADVR